MGKGNILYEVHAGYQTQPYCPVVYETTKESKAHEYVRELEKSEKDYDKIYIVRKPLSRFDKRKDWCD